MGEDIYRAVARLPGISANDYFSGKFTARGGEHEEVLVLLDGIELHDAFHLKDINGGALSIVDAEAIQGIDLLTGGFPTEYGDRTSGVFNIDSRRPRAGQVRHSVGISMMNARLMSEGTFERGTWLVSARRGYLDLVLALMNEEEDLSPKYYDVLGKVEYELSPDHGLSAHLLHADDDLSLLEGDKDDSKTGYGNSYGWLNLKSAIGPRLCARTTLFLGRVTADRIGIGFEGDEGVVPDFTVTENRHLTVAGLKQDWRYEATRRHYLKWGVDLKRLRATYDYLSADTWYSRPAPDSLITGIDSTVIGMQPSANRIGLYVADRFRVLAPLAVEAGLRYDAAPYADDQLISPRINFVYNLGKRTRQTNFATWWLGTLPAKSGNPRDQGRGG